MEYAIVDIETTGGKPHYHDITEIAIVITDGRQVLDRFSSLVYTSKDIPPFIQALTGITSDLIKSAPPFRAIASKVFDMLRDRVFVAHNVNFDFKFVNYHLQDCGYLLTGKKLCSVRLARKIFSGLPSYSLGRLCHSLGIQVTGRHRAMGDALATTELFHRMLRDDNDAHIQTYLDKKQREFSLPPNLSKEAYINLPVEAGIYYMLDEKARPLYIGKAKNIKKRIASHFSASFGRKNYQALYTRIHHLDWQLTGNELVASLLESYEIKRNQPPFNRAQRRAGKAYNIVSFVDQNGWLRLAPEKSFRNPNSIATFTSLGEVRSFLYGLAGDYQLCDKILFLSSQEGACEGTLRGSCAGTCTGSEMASEHNERLEGAIRDLNEAMEKTVIMGSGRTAKECSIVCCNNGQYLGFGFIEKGRHLATFDEALDLIKTYPADADAQGIIQAFLSRTPKGYEVVQMTGTPIPEIYAH